MISISLYFMTLLCITIYTFVKQYNILGKILFVLYSLIGLFSVIAVSRGVFQLETSFFAYVFLIITYIIYFQPFLKRNNKFSVSKVVFGINKRYFALMLLYIVCSVITIRSFAPSIVKLLASGDWAMNRYNLYLGELEFPYSNRFEYLAINFTDYFRLITQIVAFAILRTEEKTLVKASAYIAIACSFVSMLCSAVYTSSRGSIINAIFLILALYCFFQEDYQKNRKRFFTVLIVLGIAVIAPYLIEVSVSRFSDGAVDSLVSYVGQPPVVFSSGVWGITKHLYGKFAFGRLWGYSGFSESLIGGSWDNGFYTFVGWLYIDWGMIGVIIIGIIMNLFLSRLLRKKNYRLSDLYLVLLYYSTLLQGVFVIGRGYCYTIVVGVIIYFILRVFFEKICISY